ncbi:hypothetical protein HG530_013740 [Fusarium avenaceum]|nr:hypothetical protein HG530_013740 [Fusarium avenaceum]
MENEHAAVEELVRRGRRRGGLYWLTKRCWVRQWCVGAVLCSPILGCPRVRVKITHADVIRGNPIIRQMRLYLEHAVHVIQDGHVGVKIAHSVVLDELENAQLGPRVSEALGDERHFDSCGWNLHNRTRRALVKIVQCFHVLVVEIKFKDIDVGSDAVWGVALGKRNPVLLQTVADEDLARCDFVLVCNAVEGLVVGLLVPHEWGVGLDDDVVLLTILYGLSLLVPRM